MVISHDEVLLALKHLLDFRSGPLTATSTLSTPAEFILSLHCFLFVEDFYHLVSRMPMGTRMVPNYANLFVGHIEAQIFSRFTGLTSKLYSRYIDDSIDATSVFREQPDSFFSFVLPSCSRIILKCFQYFRRNSRHFDQHKPLRSHYLNLLQTHS